MRLMSAFDAPLPALDAPKPDRQPEACDFAGGRRIGRQMPPVVTREAEDL